MGFKFEDAVFWILLLGALGIILWLLHGSPTLEEALLSLTILIISSEFMLWKKYYQVDKNIAVSFTRFKADLKSINQQLGRMETKIDDLRPALIKTKLRRRT